MKMPLTAACVLCVVTPVAARTAIYTTLADSDTSLIPGGGGQRFTNFDRPVYSPGRNYFGFLADNDSPVTTVTDLYFVAPTTGGPGSGVVAALEGATPLTFGADTFIVDGIGERRFGIGDDGSYGFLVSTNTGEATFDDFLAVGSVFTTGLTGVIREGVTPIPGISGGVFDGFDSVTYSATAGFGGRATSIDNLPSNQQTAAFLNNGTQIVAQINVTSPPGASGGVVTALAFGGFRSDGVNSLTRATVTGGTSVVLYNGALSLFVGQTLPGLPGPIDAFYSTGEIQPDGGFLQIVQVDAPAAVGGESGFIIDETGSVVVGVGDAVVGLPGETFADDVFTGGADFAFANRDTLGNLLVGGFSSVTGEGIYVYNGVVVAREGDEVDLDGDGIGDGVFLGVFGTSNASLNNFVDNGFLVGDGTFILGTELADASGTLIGEGYVRIVIPEPATATLLGVVVLVTLRRRRRAV